MNIDFNKPLHIIILVLLLVMTIFIVVSILPKSNYYSTDIKTILANPDYFIGKNVKVNGILHQTTNGDYLQDTDGNTIIVQTDLPNKNYLYTDYLCIVILIDNEIVLEIEK